MYSLGLDVQDVLSIHSWDLDDQQWGKIQKPAVYSQAQPKWIIDLTHCSYSNGCDRADVPEIRFIPSRQCIFSRVNLSSCSHLWSAAPVDVHTDGTVCSAAAHEQMSSVIRLHHPDEVPTAVLENTDKQRETREKFSRWEVTIKKLHSDTLR